MALPDPKTDLAAAFDALGRCDMELISAVASRVRDDGEEPALYLRIAGNNRRAVTGDLHGLARSAKDFLDDIGDGLFVPAHTRRLHQGERALGQEFRFGHADSIRRRSFRLL